MAGALRCFSACLQALQLALNVSQQAVPVLEDGVFVGGEVLDVTVDPGDLAGGLQPSVLGSGAASGLADGKVDTWWKWYHSPWFFPQTLRPHLINILCAKR